MKNYLVLLLLFFGCQTAHADWVKQNSNTLAWLRDVFFINESRGWIVGSNGTVLATENGGKSWIKSRNFTEDNILQIYFSDEKNGWLLCERNVYTSGSNSPSYLMKTGDGGASWSQISLPSGRERLSKIIFSTENTGLAIGESGAYYILQEDGKTWKKHQSPVPFLLLDGVFTDDSRAAIVGAGGTILFSEDAGLTWNKAEFADETKTKLNSIYFINKKSGWTVGTGGKIYQTINGGKLWYKQNSNTGENLNDVFFINTAEGWAVGDEGTVLHTSTAGNIWEIEPSHIKHKLEKLFFNGEKGWAVGFGGTILNYDNKKPNNKKYSQPEFRQKN